MKVKSKLVIFAALFLAVGSVVAAPADVEERKEAKLSHIRSISDAAGYVGYYGAMNLTQAMLRKYGKKQKNDEMNYTLEMEDILFMTQKVGGHLKELDENLESVKDNAACVSAYLKLTEYSRTANFFRTLVESLKVVKSPAGVEAKLTADYNEFHKNSDKNIFELVQNSCAK